MRNSEEAAKLHASEFVMSFADWGDRGRMRGSSCAPDCVLHRSKCPALWINREDGALLSNPASIYATTESEWKASRGRGSANKYRICKRCCKDLAGAK